MEHLSISSMWISKNGDIETVIECKLCDRKRLIKKINRIFRKYQVRIVPIDGHSLYLKVIKK